MSTCATPEPKRGTWEQILWVIRRIIGVPDYERYLAHVTAHHPNERPLGPEEFVRQRQVDRYSRPGSRCC